MQKLLEYANRGFLKEYWFRIQRNCKDVDICEDRRKKMAGKVEAKMSNGIPNGDSRSPKFPEDATYDDIYW